VEGPTPHRSDGGLTIPLRATHPTARTVRAGLPPNRRALRSGPPFFGTHQRRNKSALLHAPKTMCAWALNDITNQLRGFDASTLACERSCPQVRRHPEIVRRLHTGFKFGPSRHVWVACSRRKQSLRIATTRLFGARWAWPSPRPPLRRRYRGRLKHGRQGSVRTVPHETLDPMNAQIRGEGA
jgi:hypothetical protein